MKNLKLIFVPIGIIATVLALFSFTQFGDGDDKKCKVKIVKIVNGVETVVDSTFDCDDHLNWIDSFNGKIDIDGDSTHKSIQIMMLGDDSNDVNMNFDILKDGENGKIKMVVNGEEVEIELSGLEEVMKELKNGMNEFHHEMENVEVILNDEEGGNMEMVKIIKKEDDDGNVTIKKIVNGEEVELSEEDMVHIEHLENETMGNKHIKIDIDVDDENMKGKHIIMISKVVEIDDKKDMAKRVPVAKNNLNKNELAVDKLKFNPNPNNGVFDLKFELTDKSPVQVKIMDMNGKEVYDDQVNNFSGNYSQNIDISEHGAGIYLLQIVQGKSASTHKIVIQ